MSIPLPTIFDFANTKRIPSLCNFIRNSAATYQDYDATWREVPANTPRFNFDQITGECLGIFIEKSGTNMNTNPRGIGVIAGTPGTNPTGWSYSGNGGITREIIGYTTINGITGISFRFTGTPTSSVQVQSMTFGTADVVSIGTVVTNSIFISLVAGSFTNVTGLVLRCASESPGTAPNPTSTLKRVSDTVTTTGTASSTILRWNYSDTVTPVDFTLFIGWPQREHDTTYPSSPILPSGNTVASTTRSAEQLNISTPYLRLSNTNNSMNFSVLFEGTLKRQTPSGESASIWQIDDGVITERIFLRSNASTNSIYIFRSSGGSGVLVGNVNVNSVFKVVTSVDGNGNGYVSMNGGDLVTFSNSALTNNFTTFRIGSRNSGVDSLNSEIRRISVFPEVLDQNTTILLSG